jgi:hypothetical protein
MTTLGVTVRRACPAAEQCAAGGMLRPASGRAARAAGD